MDVGFQNDVICFLRRAREQLYRGSQCLGTGAGKSGSVHRAYFSTLDIQRHSVRSSNRVRLARHDRRFKKENIAAEKIEMIENGLNYPFCPMGASEAAACLEKFRLPKELSYVLHVGKTSFYKNHPALLRIFAQLRTRPPDLHLVTVGAQFEGRLGALVRELNLMPYLLPLAPVSNENLRTLYSTAEALIFPSLAEGFGWPVIEAQACGCPVFASNRPPIPYVGGEAAVYFDADNTEEAAQIIHAHWGRRDDMRTVGLVNVAARFTTEKMIDRYLDYYRRILRQPEA